jgi:hypothetical protein
MSCRSEVRRSNLNVHIDLLEAVDAPPHALVSDEHVVCHN